MSKATRILLTVMMVVCRVLDRLFYCIAYVAGWLSSVCATRYMRLRFERSLVGQEPKQPTQMKSEKPYFSPVKKQKRRHDTQVGKPC